MNTPTPLTASQLDYLDGLRSGDALKSKLSLTDQPDNRISDTNKFKAFLADNGQSDPVEKVLEMRIPKQQLVDLLSFFDQKGCLLLTNCFGLTRSIKGKGRVVLISRGSFWQSSSVLADVAVWGNFYTEIGSSDTKSSVVPAYRDLNLKKPIDDSKAQRYIQNFLNLYQDGGEYNTHGYFFPVKAMLQVLNDPTKFGSETYLRISWGVYTYTAGIVGNFSIFIHADDTDRNGYCIEFRGPSTVPNDGDCPPKAPCNPPPSQTQ